MTQTIVSRGGGSIPVEAVELGEKCMLHPIHQYLAGHHQRKQENLPFHVLPHKVDFAHIANEDDGQEDYLVEPLHNVCDRKACGKLVRLHLQRHKTPGNRRRAMQAMASERTVVIP